MSNKITNIAGLLPEGLDESTVEKIFELVDSTINDQVEQRINLLESKVNAFLRTKIDSLKEQALTELAQENEIFRNAKLFESVKALMTLEISQNDEENLVSEMTETQKELDEEVSVLTTQLNKLIEENEKLQNTIKALNSKVHLSESKIKKLEKGNTLLSEEIENLQAVIDEPFASSEKAVLISEANREVKQKNEFVNPFLNNEAMMRLMPSNK
jgi:uncharacterized phage infection (PIP) family protein YhgE